MLNILKKIASFFYKDLPWKLMSLVLAYLIWLVGQNITDPLQNESFYRTLQLSNTEVLERDDIVLLNEETLKTTEIEVNVRAPESAGPDLRDQTDAIRASIDLSDIIISSVKAADEPVTVQLNVDVDISHPEGDRMFIKPRTVNLRLDKFERRNFTVQIYETGAVDENYELVGTKSSYETIIISAAKSIIDEISEVQAGVDVEGATGTFDTTSPIKVIDELGNDMTERVELNHTETVIRATVLPQKAVRLSIDYTGQLRYNHVVTETVINPAEVLIIGMPDVLEEIDEIKLEPLDLTNQGETYTSEANITSALPSNIQLKTGEPATAGVIYTIEPLVTKEVLFPSGNIYMHGYTNLSVRPLGLGSVAILLQAPSSLIDDVDADDLTVQLDLNGLDVGEHNVQLSVITPESVSVVGSYAISVEITDIPPEPPEDEPDENIDGEPVDGDGTADGAPDANADGDINDGEQPKDTETDGQVEAE